MVNGQPTLTTVEHEYQAQKFELAFHDPAYAAHIRSIPVNHPEQAKHVDVPSTMLAGGTMLAVKVGGLHQNTVQ